MFKDWFIMFHVELTTCSLLNPHQDGISDPCSPFPPGALKHRRHLFLQAPQGRSCLVHHVGLVRTTHATLAMWGLTENAFRWWFAHQSVGNLGFVDWGNCICVNWLICIYIYIYKHVFSFSFAKKNRKSICVFRQWIFRDEISSCLFCFFREKYVKKKQLVGHMPCPYLPVMYKYHLLTVLVHLTILLGELYQFLSGIHYMISKFGSIARVFVTFQHPDLSCTGSTKSQTSKIYYSWFTIFAINMFGRWKSCHSGIFPLTRHHL